MLWMGRREGNDICINIWMRENAKEMGENCIPWMLEVCGYL
jgi:hypothetical protein